LSDWEKEGRPSGKKQNTNFEKGFIKKRRPFLKKETFFLKNGGESALSVDDAGKRREVVELLRSHKGGRIKRGNVPMKGEKKEHRHIQTMEEEKKGRPVLERERDGVCENKKRRRPGSRLPPGREETTPAFSGKGEIKKKKPHGKGGKKKKRTKDLSFCRRRRERGGGRREKRKKTQRRKKGKKEREHCSLPHH